jgi:hypothetical protein
MSLSKQSFGVQGSKFKVEFSPKGQLAPKSPKGDFHKLLNFYRFPAAADQGAKNNKNQHFVAFRSGLKLQRLKGT